MNILLVVEREKNSSTEGGNWFQRQETWNTISAVQPSLRFSGSNLLHFWIGELGLQHSTGSYANPGYNKPLFDLIPLISNDKHYYFYSHEGFPTLKEGALLLDETYLTLLLFKHHSFTYSGNKRSVSLGK